MNRNEANDFFDNIIYSYARQQAIDDGVLVDLMPLIKKENMNIFRMPIAATAAVWDSYIEWTDEDTTQQTYQDTNGRLWDVLSMLRFAIAQNRDTDYLIYKLHVVPRDGVTRKAKLTQLKAVIGDGDNGEPVITIMLPNED